MTVKVLYVDDEPSNLLVFKAQFKKHMEIFTAGSGRQALEILEHEEIPVVLSDQRMPEMSGADLLAEVRRRHPDVVRMIVTAYTDFAQVVRSINESHVQRYITKPWDPGEVQSILSGACELYWKAKENRSLTEDVLHQERLVAIGTVTVGLVRELEAIGRRFEPLETLESKAAAEATSDIELFQGGVRELSAVLHGLRLYSRRALQEGPNEELEDLNMVVSLSSEIIRLFPIARGTEVLSLERCSDRLLVEIDIERIKQIIVNLALHLLTHAKVATPSLMLKTKVDGDSAVVTLSGEGIGFSDASATVLEEGLLAGAKETESGFWLLLAQKVVGDHGGQIRGGKGGVLLELRLPLSRSELS